MSNLNKETIIQLENTASYQSTSDLNVMFRTADRGSAIFYFNVTKDDEPLLLSEENIKARIAIRKQGVLVIAPIEIEDPFNGLLKYTLPNDVLQRDGKYTAQVLVSETGESNVAVAERIFTFDVEKSLFSGIDAETKLSYIVEFQDLEKIIMDRSNVIDKAMENGEDYVNQINGARTKGLSDIKIAKATSIQEINTLADTKLQQIRIKGDEYSTKFDKDKVYVDEKVQDFRESVKGSNVVTEGASKDWQKYKFTNEDGTRIYINKANFTHIDSLKPGFYEVVTNVNSAQGMPVPSTGPSADNSIFDIDVWITPGRRKQYRARQNYSNRVWEKTIHTNNADTGWKEVAFIDPDNPFETTQDATEKANTAESNSKTYTDERISETNEVIYEGSAKGVGAIIKLTKPYDKFDELKLFTRGHGSSEPYIRDTDSRNIVMYSFNLTDSAADNGDIVETQIIKTDKQTLTFKNVGAYNLPTAKGTINSSLGLEVYKIVGVRYLANINK